MLYYFLFFVILVLAILATFRCIRKPSTGLVSLVFILFSLAISMVIPGYAANFKFPNGIQGEAKSLPLLKQWLSPIKQLSFRLENTSAEQKIEKIKFESKAPIQNVSLNQGSNVFKVIDGGTGNNYAIYQVSLPPGQVATGSVMSSDAVTIAPFWGEVENKK